MVVLAEEHHGSLVARGEHHGLVHVAFTRGTIAKVGKDRSVGTIQLDAHGIAGGVQALGTNDDLGGSRQIDAQGIPAIGGVTSPYAGDLGEVGTTHIGHAAFPVARENEVVVPQ